MVMTDSRKQFVTHWSNDVTVVVYASDADEARAKIEKAMIELISPEPAAPSAGEDK